MVTAGVPACAPPGHGLPPDGVGCDKPGLAVVGVGSCALSVCAPCCHHANLCGGGLTLFLFVCMGVPQLRVTGGRRWWWEGGVQPCTALGSRWGDVPLSPKLVKPHLCPPWPCRIRSTCFIPAPVLQHCWIQHTHAADAPHAALECCLPLPLPCVVSGPRGGVSGVLQCVRMCPVCPASRTAPGPAAGGGSPPTPPDRGGGAGGILRVCWHTPAAACVVHL